MRKKTVRLSAARALELAADQAGIELAGLQTVDLNIDSDGLYDIGFQDEWMRYSCYVDYLTGEVRGFLQNRSILYNRALWGSKLDLKEDSFLILRTICHHRISLLQGRIKKVDLHKVFYIQSYGKI